MRTRISVPRCCCIDDNPYIICDPTWPALHLVPKTSPLPVQFNPGGYAIDPGTGTYGTILTEDEFCGGVLNWQIPWYRFQVNGDSCLYHIQLGYPVGHAPTVTYPLDPCGGCVGTCQPPDYRDQRLSNGVTERSGSDLVISTHGENHVYDGTSCWPFPQSPQFERWFLFEAARQGIPRYSNDGCSTIIQPLERAGCWFRSRWEPVVAANDQTFDAIYTFRSANAAHFILDMQVEFDMLDPTRPDSPKDSASACALSFGQNFRLAVTFHHYRNVNPLTGVVSLDVGHSILVDSPIVGFYGEDFPGTLPLLPLRLRILVAFDHTTHLPINVHYYVNGQLFYDEQAPVGWLSNDRFHPECVNFAGLGFNYQNATDGNFTNSTPVISEIIPSGNFSRIFDFGTFDAAHFPQRIDNRVANLIVDSR